MTFVYIVFTWLIAMIAWNIYKGKKEKEQMIISKGGMKKYFKYPMTMSIGERMRRKGKLKW